VDALQVDLNWISPTSGNKFGPVGLAATATTVEDPQCSMVAQVSFWWLGGGAFLVEHGGISIRVGCVPRQR
jgi:hypothetical protein